MNILLLNPINIKKEKLSSFWASWVYHWFHDNLLGLYLKSVNMSIQQNLVLLNAHINC